MIALSANATESDVEIGRNAGFYDYLTKPIDVRAALQTIETALGVKGYGIKLINYASSSNEARKS